MPNINANPAMGPCDAARTLEPAARRHRLDRLEGEITELWGHINAASYRFLELVAEYDRLKGHEQHGLVNCAQWLNWQCGIGDVAAREKVRVARALESLPRIRDAFRRGIVSYSKVRAMTRVATPEDEHVLLNTALYGTAAHVERHVRKFRWCERRDAAAEANKRHRLRRLSCFHDEDGSLVIHAVLPPEVGAIVEKALEAALEAVDEPAAVEAELRDASEAYGSDIEIEIQSNVSAETSEARLENLTGHNSFGAKRADALALLAESYLERRTEARGSVADRFQVCVHIDERLLRTRPGRPGPAPASPHVAARARAPCMPAAVDAERLMYAELEGSDRPLAVETARRLGCDASLVGIVDGTLGEPLSVGRRMRGIPPALQRALRIRDGGCRFPGCGRTRFTQGHHVIHWADGGETKLSNVVTLCRFHHRLVHEGGYGVVSIGGGTAPVFIFTRPDGTRLEPNGRRPPVDVAARRAARADPEAPFERGLERLLFALNRERGLEIDAATARCGWTGESMDYSAAIEAQQYCRGRRF